MATAIHDEAVAGDHGETPEGRNWRALLGSAVIALLVIALVIASGRTGQLDRLIRTALTVVAVLIASAALFTGSNALISQATSSWARFRALAGALAGLAGFALLRGNRSVGSLIGPTDYFLAQEPGEPPLLVNDAPDLIEILEGVADPELLEIGSGVLGHVEWPVVGLLLGGLVGLVTGVVPNRALRVGLAAAIGSFAGWFIAVNLQFQNRPDTTILTILIGAAVGLAGGALIGAATHRVAQRALFGAAFGALAGGWLVPETLGTGSLSVTIAAMAAPLGLLCAAFAFPGARTPGEVAHFSRRGRAFIFLAPALLFVLANLVVPAIRTIYTSLLDRESEDFVGLDNYRALVSDSDFIDTRNWTDIFTSQLFLVGLALLAGGLLIGFLINQLRNNEAGFERTAGSVGPVLLGLFLVTFAGFSVIRGTLSNTLWWVLTVTVASTVIGLIIAVLAERAGPLESTAKSLIFMPMAISMVGASIIWRFQYQPRNISKNQTGVLNAAWIELGKLSHSGWPRAVLLVLIGLAFAAAVRRIVAARSTGSNFAGFVGVAIALGYLFVELVRRSLGGFTFGPDGEVLAETVLFREHAPFNNVFLMVILIWIQSGFAMVILSAAIKAVPSELLEAARIDGADESQQFFRVVLPQILPTIGVVVTTLIVLVTKVFDIVKVSTGGNFGTNVLANDFFTEAFQFLDRGLGSAIAVTILLTVAPVLIFNVWQMQREEI